MTAFLSAEAPYLLGVAVMVPALVSLVRRAGRQNWIEPEEEGRARRAAREEAQAKEAQR